MTLSSPHRTLPRTAWLPLAACALACTKEPPYHHPDSATPGDCPAVSGTAPDIVDYVQHVADHTCLTDADADGLDTAFEDFYAITDLPCHQVWRVPSADGWTFDGQAEAVLDHGSVPDVWIDADGTHWLAVNDVRPFALTEAVQDTPEALVRVGMPGIGALRLLRGSGASPAFEDVDGVDLALPEPLLVADPDIRRDADGNWDLVWLQTRTSDLIDTLDPALAAEPHRVVRSLATGAASFAPPQVVVEPTVTSIVDPTAAAAPDGSLLVYASQGLFDTIALHGWTWSPGDPPATAPDASPTVTGVMPDIAVLDSGEQRLVVMVPEMDPLELFGRSGFDAAWEPAPAPPGIIDVRNPSIGRDPDGTWWLYFNRVDPTCLAELQP